MFPQICMIKFLFLLRPSQKMPYIITNSRNFRYQMLLPLSFYHASAFSSRRWWLSIFRGELGLMSWASVSLLWMFFCHLFSDYNILRKIYPFFLSYNNCRILRLFIVFPITFNLNHCTLLKLSIRPLSNIFHLEGIAFSFRLDDLPECNHNEEHTT